MVTPDIKRLTYKEALALVAVIKNIQDRIDRHDGVLLIHLIAKLFSIPSTMTESSGLFDEIAPALADHVAETFSRN